MDFCVDDALKLDYLNGLISEKEKALFEDHLAACPRCRREIVELRKTVVAVAGLTSPSVPEAWTTAVKNRLRATRSSPVAVIPPNPASDWRRTNVFQYALIAAGVTAGLGLLLWLVLEGTIQGWLPGLSAAALGISEPRAARTVDLLAWILSLHTMLLVPSIIDNIYRLVQRDGRESRPRRSAGFLAR